MKRAYDAAPDERAMQRIADTRKALTAAAMGPPLLNARLRNATRPFVLHHWVTLRCNCSCQSCLWKNNQSEDMTTAQIKKFYREAAEQGFVGMLLGGGEPLLRKDIGDIFHFAKYKCGWKIGTATNGWFLEDRIREYGDCIDTMIVSIDNADPARHDEIRGVPGLFDRVVRGIEKVRREYPFMHLMINTCVTDNCADDLMDIVALAGDLGVPLSLDVISTGRNMDGEGYRDQSGHLISSFQSIAAALHRALEAKKNGARIFNSEYYLTHFDHGKQPYACRYPRIFLRVMSNGDVEDCTQVGRPIASVLETPLADILASPRMAEFRDRAEKCYSCSSPAMIESSRFWDDPATLISRGTMLTA